MPPGTTSSSPTKTTSHSHDPPSDPNHQNTDVLNGTLTLHDIKDVESYCIRIINRATIDLQHQDREDLLAYLIETTWELSRHQDPTRGAFSKWAGYKLTQRITDWQRQTQGRTKWQFAGRTHHRPRPTLVPLHDRLDQPDHSIPMDDQAHSLADLIGILRERTQPASTTTQPSGSTNASSSLEPSSPNEPNPLPTPQTLATLVHPRPHLAPLCGICHPHPWNPPSRSTP